MLWNASWFKRNAPSKKHHYLSGAFERVAVMLSVTKSHKTGKWPTNHCKGTLSRRGISTNSLRVGKRGNAAAGSLARDRREFIRLFGGAAIFVYLLSRTFFPMAVRTYSSC